MRALRNASPGVFADRVASGSAKARVIAVLPVEPRQHPARDYTLSFRIACATRKAFGRSLTESNDHACPTGFAMLRIHHDRKRWTAMVLCVSAAMFAWHDASFCLGQDIEFELHAPNTPGQPPIPGRIRGDTLEFDLTGNGKSIEYKRDITLDSDFHQGYRSARPDRRPLRFPRHVRGELLQLKNGSTWSRTIYIAIPPPPPPPPMPRPVVRPEPPLPSANVFLANRHDQDLYVRIHDFSEEKPTSQEIKLKPGETTKMEFSRDSGASISWRDEDGQVLDKAPVKVDPRPLYEITVDESRIQSLYLDRTGKDQLVPEGLRPPGQQMGRRRVGSFLVPAGTMLRPNAELDVYGMAKQALPD